MAVHRAESSGAVRNIDKKNKIWLSSDAFSTGEQMRRIFVLRSKYGQAVIVADDAADAWQRLQDHEQDPFLTFGVKPSDLIEITAETPTGVVAYFAS